MYDVVIVGGGPAGLSAALVLGRCRRRIVVCDAAQPRNASSRQLNGYLTRDGIAPRAFLEIGREQLHPYGVEQRHETVTDVRRDGDEFRVLLQSGDTLRSATILLATGVRDNLPPIHGLADCYGISVHHCPYCDGWEVQDKRIAALGYGTSPAGLALSLKTWSSHVVACSHGMRRLRASETRKLREQHIPVYGAAVARVEHHDGRVGRLVFQDGDVLECDAIFFTAPQHQQSPIARELGCEFTSRGTVRTDHLGQTCVPGVYVVGDASRDVQFVVVAAAEGAKAGVAINKALQLRSGLVAVKSGVERNG